MSQRFLVHRELKLHGPQKEDKMSIRFYLLLAFLIAFSTRIAFGRTIIVDKSGLGSYTSIQAGINAALAGDTVKVYPGVYNEQVSITANIVVQGSGYEYTQIVSNGYPAVGMSSGKMMWFAISSNTGDGVLVSGGIISNCVVWNCATYGIAVVPGSSPIIENDDIVNNNNYGIYVASGSATVINTIVKGSYGSTEVSNVSGSANILYSLYYNLLGVSGTGNINLLDSDPLFVSDTDLQLQAASPCIDTGKPDIYDPDGTRSDMGYYGGPDAPVFPVVTNLRIYLNTDGTVNVQATAQSRY